LSLGASITIPPNGQFTPSGTLQVMDAGVVVFTSPVSGTVVMFTLSLTAGTHPLTAVYSGDSHFLGSTSPVLNQVVNPAGPKNTTVTMVSSPNPATLGGPLTLTAVVSPTGATGVVGFNEYGQGTVTSWGSATLVNGTATVTIPSLPNSVGAGTHSIQANYHGDASYKNSNSAPLSQQVVKQAATVSLSSNTNPGILGTQLSILATASGPAGSTTQPTGSVQLFDGATSLGTANLAGGVAQFPVTFTTTGTHSLTAVYSGDAGFAGVTSLPLSEVVKKYLGSFGMTMTPNPSIAGSGVTFNVWLDPSTATGTITFADGNPPTVTLGIVTLVNGSASFTTSSLSAGTHTLSITYSGDDSFVSSVSNPVLVVKVASTTALAATPATAVYGQAVQLTAAVVPAAATGTVQFLDGATVLGTVPVNSGAAVLSVPSFSAGAHSITATYSGDATYGGSTSAAVAVTVSKATPSIAISSSLNPAPYMQAITFTVALTPATATGGVQLLDGATAIATLAAGTTTASVTLNVGTHSVTAVYGGDSNFNGATSAPVSQLVTTTTITSGSATPANSTYGQPVQVTATVTPTPTGGALQFLDGGTVLGSAAVQSGVASLAVAGFGVGTHSITAIYSGDGAIYLGSTSAVFYATVNKAATTAMLAVSPNPAVVGQAVTLTAAVSPATATGTVQFLDGATSLGTLTVSNGAAMLTVPSFPAGTHPFTAVYSGDATYLGSTSAVFTETVNKAATSDTLAVSPNPAVAGQAVTLTAAVSPATATGTMQFLDGATSLGTVTVSSGAALLTVPSFPAGTHSLTAVYSGDATNSGSTSNAVALTVAKAASTISIGSSLNPSPAGQAVVFTIALTPAAATGTVQLLDGATVLANLSAGTTSASVTLAVGTHSVTAVYSGDANFNGATSAQVNQLVTTTTSTSVSASPANSAYGQAVQLTATVTPAPAGGSVQFLDGSTVLGSVAVQGGSASLSVTTFAVGTHAITAVYGGNGAGYLGSTSAAFTETVSKDATTATLSSSANPAVAGHAVTLSAAVSPATATGTVQFLDGAASLGVVTLNHGAASLTTSALAAGSHALTVAYSGDATNAAATSAVLTQSVVKTATTTALTSSLNPSVSGHAVTFTAQVSPSAATGSIQFVDGSSLLGTVTVSGGSAALAVSSLSVGAHSITATYSGDANYTGSASTALTQTVTAPPPGAPSNLTATAASAGQINLAWTASATSGVTYNVYSATTSGFTPSAGNRIASGVTATSYSHTGLSPSTVHYYLVTAQNSAGESAASNQASATTQSGLSCHVGYSVASQWNVGFGTAITIKNTGSKAINGWTLTWTWPGNQQITQAWDASYTQTGKNASLTNLSYDAAIAAGATISGIGFNASYSGTNTAPTAFYVNGTLCQ
jgi:hypothetical protein